MMSNFGNSGNNDDIHICSSSVFSHYIQVGRMKLIQVDLVPFVMQSQFDGGWDTDWFTKKHLYEVMMLVRPVLESCVESKCENEVKKSEKSTNCIFTGDSVRVVYTIKEHTDHNNCLITHFGSQNQTRNKASASKDQPSFQEKLLHKSKMVAFVCPKINVSLLQLSQLVHPDVDSGRNQGGISKYFQPISSI